MLMLRATAAVTLAGLLPAQVPTDEAFARLRDQIVPSKDELGWRSVPWRPELRTALVEANRAGKPVLLWAMNGHPLGQT